MILHIFMYNVISDFSAATPASKGRVNLHRLTWIELTGYQAKLNLTDFPKVQDAHMG